MFLTQCLLPKTGSTAVTWRDSWIHQIILDLQLHWWKWEFGTRILKPSYLYYGKLLTLFHYFRSCLGSYAITLGRILAVFPAVIPNDLTAFWWDKYNKLNNGAKNIYWAQKGTFPSALHSIAQQAETDYMLLEFCGAEMTLKSSNEYYSHFNLHPSTEQTCHKASL